MSIRRVVLTTLAVLVTVVVAAVGFALLVHAGGMHAK